MKAANQYLKLVKMKLIMTEADEILAISTSISRTLKFYAL
mgnify:CR=1 FL=1